MASKESVQIDGGDLDDLLERLGPMREEMGMSEIDFAVAMTFAASHLCERLGVEVTPVPEVEEVLN